MNTSTAAQGSFKKSGQDTYLITTITGDILIREVNAESREPFSPVRNQEKRYIWI